MCHVDHGHVFVAQVIEQDTFFAVIMHNNELLLVRSVQYLERPIFSSWFCFRSEEAVDDDDSLISTDEKNSGGSLEADCDQTFNLENKLPSHKQDGSGRSQVSASSGGSESDEPNTKCEVFKCVGKGCSTKPEWHDQTFQTPNFLLSEGALKNSGCWKEASGTSKGNQEERNKSVKDSTTKWTCNTPESENKESSDVYNGGSVHICQVQTADPAGTLKVNILYDVFKSFLVSEHG